MMYWLVISESVSVLNVLYVSILRYYISSLCTAAVRLTVLYSSCRLVAEVMACLICMFVDLCMLMGAKVQLHLSYCKYEEINLHKKSISEMSFRGLIDDRLISDHLWKTISDVFLYFFFLRIISIKIFNDEHR